MMILYLHGLAKAHGVGQDAAEAGGGVILCQRLHDVVVQEPDTSNLDMCVSYGKGSTLQYTRLHTSIGKHGKRLSPGYE